MLKVKNLFVSYTKEFYTLNDISFELGASQRLVVVGGKESGRTVLVRTLVGLETPAKGDILIKNISIEKIDFENDISLGYLPANPVFLENKTVKQNLEYVLNIREKDAKFNSVKVNNAIVEYGLDYIKNKKIKGLNFLERIKVAIARFSLRSIDLFIIDDIFAKMSKEEAKKTIKNLKELFRINNASAIIMVDSDAMADAFGYSKKYLIYGSLQDTPNYDIPKN